MTVRDEITISREICSEAGIRRIAAMLDQNPVPLMETGLLPRGWQFLLMGADTARSALRSDGFPGLGVPMPDLGLPRLLLGGRTVQYLGDIPIGAKVTRTSSIAELTRKESKAGHMAIIKIAHTLQVDGQAAPALRETQTYVLLPEGKYVPTVYQDEAPPIEAEHLVTLTPDDTLLFQYSALGFNTHKIHLDRHHARDVEGFPDLVVNGGLITLLMNEFMRRDLRLVPQTIKTRHLAPLFSNHVTTIAATPHEQGWMFKAYNEKNRLAAEMEITIQ
jgi:3-methylfumaryl-CoA hydratase